MAAWYPKRDRQQVVQELAAVQEFYSPKKHTTANERVRYAAIGLICGVWTGYHRVRDACLAHDLDRGNFKKQIAKKEWALQPEVDTLRQSLELDADFRVSQYSIAIVSAVTFPAITPPRVCLRRRSSARSLALLAALLQTAAPFTTSQRTSHQ